MNRKDIWEAVELELRTGKKKHPGWPDHVAAQAGIVCEEAGELMKAALQIKYEREDTESLQLLQKEDLRKEAIHTVAVAIRFLENLK